MRIAHGAWVVVANGGQALVLYNQGGPAKPELVLVGKNCEASAEARAHERDPGTGRPGHHPDAGGGREAMEEGERHALARRAFLDALADRLDRAALAGAMEELVIVAPDEALGVLRDRLSDRVRRTIRTEMARDLTHHPLQEIEAALAAH